MKKSFLILASLAVAFGISGCNKPEPSEPETTNAPATPPKAEQQPVPVAPPSAEQRPAPPSFSTSKPLHPAAPGSPTFTNRPEGLRFVSPKTSSTPPPTLTIVGENFGTLVPPPVDPANHWVVLKITPGIAPGPMSFRIYNGVQSGVYTNITDVNLNLPMSLPYLTATVRNLMPGQTYYFAATTLNPNEAETGFGPEIMMKTSK